MSSKLPPGILTGFSHGLLLNIYPEIPASNLTESIPGVPSEIPLRFPLKTSLLPQGIRPVRGIFLKSFP